MKKMALAIIAAITLANSVKAEEIAMPIITQEISQKTTSFKEKMKNLSLSAKEKLVTTFVKSQAFVKNHKKTSLLIFLTTTALISIYLNNIKYDHLDNFKINNSSYDNPTYYSKGINDCFKDCLKSKKIGSKNCFEACLYNEENLAIKDFYKCINYKTCKDNVINLCHKVFDFYKLKVNSIIDIANKNGENLSNNMPSLNQLEKISCEQLTIEKPDYLYRNTAKNMSNLTKDLLFSHSNSLCIIGSKYFSNFCNKFAPNINALKSLISDLHERWVNRAYRYYYWTDDLNYY